jgi:predicted DNA-binding protein
MVIIMSDKFVIKPRKIYGETSVVSARLPNEIIKQLDDVATKTGRSRNELIMMCVDFALQNLEIDNSDK